ncbi:restriction endonuclease subunit S [Helicobacter pylori]|uniref:restriction endonuclease subunit S n=1 Tax=Helicobacter pylori TaxID=210 RepID=UPI000FDDFF4E|nr:restriction endonuclease subunit S [Helicobacter pylori]RVY17414.1 restriction endonuclease subunit S [Helicobacter pylori]
MDALTTPSNWQRVRLGDILELLTDYHANGSYELLKNNVTLLKHVDFAIMIRTTNFENNDFKNDLIYINKKAYEFLSKSKVFAGDILVNKIANAGTAYFMPKLNQPVSLGMNLFLLRIKPNYNNFFIFKQIANYERVLKTFANGSATKTITKNVIKNLLIPLPPLNEQIAIANILSDVDRYLYSLDALILKKESVKKALSFELLSQRKRLKGFNQAWQRVKVKDFGIIITGSTPLTQISEYWNGTISWITPTDINDNKDIFNSERKITQKGLDTIRMIPKNSVLVTCIASIGKNAILRVNGACNQQINAIIPNKDFNADFIYYLMENNKQYLLGKAGVTATYIISKQVFEEIDFFVPKDLNEQIAIANVLSALDHEIASLKNKKRQFENIKKALNHDLMSAKIRVLNK